MWWRGWGSRSGTGSRSAGCTRCCTRPALMNLRNSFGEALWELMAEHDPTWEGVGFWGTHLPNLQPPPTGSWATCWQAYWRFFFERTWFRRAWTYQEALLARELVVACSAPFNQLSFDRVGSLTQILDACRWRQLLHLRYGHPTVDENPNQMVIGMFTERWRIRMYIARAPESLPREDVRIGGDVVEHLEVCCRFVAAARVLAGRGQSVCQLWYCQADEAAPCLVRRHLWGGGRHDACANIRLDERPVPDT